MDARTRKLDIGSGMFCPKGFIGVDLEPCKAYNPGFLDVQVIANAEQGLPFKDGVFDVVRSSHSMEHFSKWVTVLCEIVRVAKNEAAFELIYPVNDLNQPGHVNMMDEQWAESNVLPFGGYFELRRKEIVPRQTDAGRKFVEARASLVVHK